MSDRALVLGTFAVFAVTTAMLLAFRYWVDDREAQQAKVRQRCSPTRVVTVPVSKMWDLGSKKLNCYDCGGTERCQ